jgi:hypothetical protein
MTSKGRVAAAGVAEAGGAAAAEGAAAGGGGLFGGALETGGSPGLLEHESRPRAVRVTTRVVRTEDAYHGDA